MKRATCWGFILPLMIAGASVMGMIMVWQRYEVRFGADALKAGLGVFLAVTAVVAWRAIRAQAQTKKEERYASERRRAEESLRASERRYAELVEQAPDAILSLDADGRRFDLVLMDVQMPVLDGLSAAGVIRERERRTGAHVPIIAMTAHTMKGDRERCMEAGMDGYVPKPVQKEELFAAMAAVRGEKSEKSVKGERRVSREKLLERVGGDEKLLDELIRVFVGDARGLLREIRSALERGDADTIARAAHAFRGSAGNFQARSAVEAAQALEQAVREGSPDRARQAARRLDDEFCRLEPALLMLLRESVT